MSNPAIAALLGKQPTTPTPSFNPLTAGVLDHAYDASSAVHGGDGTDLTSWDDLVGTLDLTTGRPNMPNYTTVLAGLGGEPGVRFDRSNTEGITSGNSGSIYANPITKLVVFELLTGVDNSFISSSGNTSYRADMLVNSGVLQIKSGASPIASSTTKPATGGTYAMWAVYSSTASKIRVNGTETSPVDAGTASTKGFMLGSFINNNLNCDCNIVFAGQGQGDLLADEAAWVADVETWADGKWRLGGWA